MALTLKEVLDQLPPTSRSGRKVGDVFEIFTRNEYMAKREEKRLDGIGVPYKVTPDNGLYLEHFQGSLSKYFDDPKSPANQQQPSPAIIRPPKPGLTCRLYDTTMTKENFIIHSGNQAAYEKLTFLLESPCNQKPICIVGPPGVGKTSLSSNILMQGNKAGFRTAYMNLQRLKRIDMSANKGVKGLALDYFPNSNLTAIDALEELPIKNGSTWMRDQVYGFVEQGLIPGFLQFLSFTGNLEQYQEFLSQIPHESLKDRLKLARPIELKYPTGGEHNLFIRKAIENSGIIISSPNELEEMVSSIDLAIPKGDPISVRGIQKYLLDVITPPNRKSPITPREVISHLAYQPGIFENTTNPTTTFDRVVQKKGYDAEVITGESRIKEVIAMKREVIKSLWDSGIKSPSELARLMKFKSPSTVRNHLEFLGLLK